MHCSNCGTANSAGARFCSNCGTALPATCPNCAASVATGARFCQNCGHALATTASPLGARPQSAAAASAGAQARLQQYIPPELLRKLEAARTHGAQGGAGERRTVTVLFCDVQGSTSLAEQLDPEEWTEIMNGAFEYLIRPVYRFEGTLARLMGDAILAFFGAPIAHEDDPWRAVRAGLEMLEGIEGYREQVRRRWGLELNVRVGINTGLVVVGEVGSDLRVEYTAMGDAVNLAARMEQTAQPGTVQISASTHRHVASLFEFERLGGIEVKGKAEPVQAYRVLRAREGAVPTRGIEGLSSPLVGRQRELDALEGAVEELLAGRGQIVSVMGEAGLGKSRLVAELRQALHAKGVLSAQPAVLSAQDSPLVWLEGRSFSYQTSSPYTPFQGLLGRYFGLATGASEAERYGRVRDRVVALAPGREGELVPFVATLLGIRPQGADADRVRFLEPPVLRARVFQATRELLAAVSARQPLLLVFEDLHWADPSSLDLLDELLALTDEGMLMILALFRPHREEPSWRFHEKAARDFAHRYLPLALERLGEREARELVANLLHIEDLPERVRALILQKAEGNPFYVEEVIRSLLDAGLVVWDAGHWRATREIEQIAVPDTLAGVITARLDRLEDEPKHLLQTAAVIGREFELDVLADISETRPDLLVGPLNDLQRRELIRERGRLPRRVYSFKHVLTQETAYGSMLLSRRREVHRRVAECLVRIDAERVGDIAHHFLQAREETRALPYVVQAGERAARAYASAEALQWFRRAIAILDAAEGADAGLARRAYEGLGRALELTRDLQGALETYRRMRYVAEGLGDIPMAVSALNKEAFTIGLRLGQLAEAEQLLARAERMAREYDDLMGMVEHATVRCGTCIPVANFDGALGYLGESADMARRSDLKEGLTLALAHVAGTLTYMTRFEEAWSAAQECLRVAHEIGDLAHVAEVQTLAIPVYQMAQGDLDTAERSAQEGMELASRIGAAFVECYGVAALAGIHHARGEYERAEQVYQRGVELGQQLGDYAMFVVPMFLSGLGAVYGDIGERVCQERWTPLAPQMEAMEPFAGATAWANLGFRALAAGQLERAEELFQRALTQPSTPWLLERPRVLVGAAFAALARGELDAATGHVEAARGFADERGMRHMLPLVEWVDGQVRLARGAAEQGLERLTVAEELARAMGMRPLVWRAQSAAAAALGALGRASEAAVKRGQALETVDEIAAGFSDPDLRAQLLETSRDAIAGVARV